MAERSSSQHRLAAGREKVVALSRSRRLRLTGTVLLALILLFGLFGFLAAPSILKNQLQNKLSAALHRPVTVGAVHVNPFTLNVVLEHLHIGDRDGSSAFVDVDKLTANASWSSVFRMAPVLDALTVEHPQIHITRLAAQQFNFSDLLETAPSPPDAKPTRFSLYNISLHNGDISFDDKVQNAAHRVDLIELGIPFITNLPHSTDVFVKPLLAMRVDGSPLRVEGQTKPFADSRESVMSFTLDHLDLPRYLGYSPTPLPVTVKSGQLSGQLDLHFVAAQPTPQLRLGGKLQLDDLAASSHNGAPLIELGRVATTLDDVEPLLSRYRLGSLQLDRLALHYTKLPGGRSNIDALTTPAPAPKASAPKPPATDARIATMTLQDGRVEYADLSGAKPARLVLDHIRANLHGLSTLTAPPANIDVSTQMADGTVTANGKLDMAASSYVGNVGMKGVSIAPLLPLGPPLLAADMKSGSLDASGQLRANWGKTFDVQLAPATLTVNQLVLSRRGRTPVAWQSLEVQLTRVDLATRTAQIDSVLLHGMKIDAQRTRDGRIDLTQLMSPQPAPTRRNARAAAATPAWHWNIRHLGVDGSAVAFKDLTAQPKPASFVIKANQFGVDGLSDSMRQPLKIDLAGGIGRGSYRAVGTVKPQPLEADLRVNTSRLDVTPLQSLIKVPLNVYVSSALMSVNGHVRYRDRKPAALMNYRGQLSFNRVRVQDKLSGDDFLRWTALTARGLNVRMGEAAPQVSIAGLALDDFYARVIINASGRLNLQDVVSNPETAPVSVTAVQTPAVAASVAQAKPAGAVSTAAPAAEIQIGEVKMSKGQLNYTDNFIKPNYTANITQLEGTIGAFGTKAGNPPAELVLQGKLDDDAPVDIGGTINPLAPVAFLDVKAKADGVELTHLSPYSGKYAGYPITKGRLTMDVHYLLDQGKLTADNHIFIDQLTFGDRMEGPGISHLPVKLAVALLKDSQGRIDVHVPVTGSLSDPHFSVGGLIWHAIVNLIGRAITAPFRLLASGGGSKQDLGYVEFAPGSSVLDKQAQERLAGIVKILKDKPSLKLDVIGRVDRKFDEAGLRKVTVEELVRAEMPDASGAAENADASDDEPANASSTAATAKPAIAKADDGDNDKYLKRAYKHAKFKKPRDLIGLTKSQPPDVMRKMLEDNVAVDDDAMRHLAERRAAAVRQWLHGKVEDSRVFALAPKLDAKGIDDSGKTTRVDFGLH